MLQVGLSIEILGFDEANALDLRALHHEHVSGEKLVLTYLDEVSDFDLAPAHIFKSIGPPVEPLRNRIVLERILAVPAVIFICILAHGREDYEDERREHGRFTV